MKKIIPFFLICTVSACASLNLQLRPHAEVERLAIESLSLRDVTLRMDVGIANPYPIGLTLKDVKLLFLVEGQQMFRSDTKKGLKVSATAKETTSFRINLKYADIMKIVKDYTAKEYLDCVADITVVIPLPKLPGITNEDLSFRYTHAIKIPAIKPTVRISNFKVHMPSMDQINQALAKAKKQADSGQVFAMFTDLLSGKRPGGIIGPDDLDLKLKVDFDIELKNQTRAKISFSDVAYDFSVNNSPLVTGTTGDVINDQAGTVIKVSNTFSSRAIGSSVLSAFRNKTGSFSLKGKASVSLPSSVSRDPLSLNFDETGTFNLQ